MRIRGFLFIHRYAQMIPQMNTNIICANLVRQEACVYIN